MINQLALFLHRTLYIAQTAQVNCNEGTATCDTGLPHVSASGGAGYGDVQTVLQLVFGAIGAIALIFIIIAALRYVTSQGDPQTTAKAKDSIIYAAIGLGIALSAELIVTFVLNNV
jgi:type IV secretion system pilin